MSAKDQQLTTKQKLITQKRKIYKSRIIVGVFNTPLSTNNRIRENYQDTELNTINQQTIPPNSRIHFQVPTGHKAKITYILGLKNKLQQI